MDRKSGIRQTSHRSRTARGDDSRPLISGILLNYPDQIVSIYAAGIVTLAVDTLRRTGEGARLDRARNVVDQHRETHPRLRDVGELVVERVGEHFGKHRDALDDEGRPIALAPEAAEGDHAVDAAAEPEPGLRSVDEVA